MGTRQEIIDYLELRQAATSAELSRSLNLGAANIRYHLRKLERDGMVYSVGLRPPVGRGRPTRVFRLTRQAGDLSKLAGALLEAHRTKEAGAEPDFADIASLLAGQPAGSGRKHITRRMYHAMQRLNELGYQAHWEAHAHAPQVILGNCPYASIIHGHPELCGLDAQLLQVLLEENLLQTSKLEHNQQGVPICVFRLQV